MRSFPFALALLFLAFAPSASAQNAAIDLEVAPETPAIAVEPGWTEVPVKWSVTFPNSAYASAALADGQAALQWQLACQGAALRLDNATTPVPLQPGSATATGVAGLRLQAAPGTRGLEPLPCMLTTAFSSSTGMDSATQAAAFGPHVEFVPGLEVEVPSGVKQAGPQKQVPFEILLKNTGNSRLQVTFELLESPSGKWNQILPEVVLVEPGETDSAIFTVATPFEQGYNAVEGSYRIRVVPAAAADPELMGEAQEVQVLARAKGWYVPGPAPALLVAALGLAAFALRQRP